MDSIARIFWLGLKEVMSLARDRAMLGLLVYAFTLGVYMDATGKAESVNNASIAVVDEDKSALSRLIAESFRPPEFQPVEEIPPATIEEAMDGGRFVFVIVVPPGFERDVLAGRSPEIQVQIDATAMEQAGLGAGYIEAILSDEIARFARGRRIATEAPVDLVVRSAFNPTRDVVAFQGIASLVAHINILSIILTGAALMREREHGTIEHLLVMPISPLEVALAKIWANMAIVLVAAILSTVLILEAFLGLTFAGSRALFLFGTILYLFSAAALGIFIASLARSMAQFALLFFLVIMPMQMLSGIDTPIESQPDWLQPLTLLLPTRHFVTFAQAIAFKGAGIDVVWPSFAALALMGIGLLALSLARFRRTMADAH